MQNGLYGNKATVFTFPCDTERQEATVAGNNTNGSLLLPDWEHIYGLALLTGDMIAVALIYPHPLHRLI